MFVIKGLATALRAIISPFACFAIALALAAWDVCFFLFGRKAKVENIAPAHDAVSVVIPSWNGRDLLALCLPPLLHELQQFGGSEVLVVDNGSTDGTCEFLRLHFPEVRVVSRKQKLGFGPAANLGVELAHNDIVILLNNDMQVEPGFIEPLLKPFADPLVFGVAAQIFLADSSVYRDETGLTETDWFKGRLRVTHYADPEVQDAFPCAYAGGGSSAFDRRKFLELGGFDDLFHPFYYEDTDLGHLAWKRGWKVLYQPRSIVVHQHRATIGKRFSAEHIARVWERNSTFFGWKNIHNWRMLGGSFVDAIGRATAGLLYSPRKSARTAFAIEEGIKNLPALLRARWKARALSEVDDREAFRRQRADYFRDRFEMPASVPKRLQVLFLSPYAVEPAVHGGAVFMRETLRTLSGQADVHLLSFVDTEEQIAAQEKLNTDCASTHFVLHKPVLRRNVFSATPRIVEEYGDSEFARALSRIVRTHSIDVVQIDFTMLSQYSRSYRHIPCFLFEHDIAFQTIGRSLKRRFTFGRALAYMQLLRFETSAAKSFARVQVCSEENKRHLLEFVPTLRGKIDTGVRAAINTSAYRFVTGDRYPNSVLFVGSFDHAPNSEALAWFLHSVWPSIRNANPEATLIVAGSGSVAPLADKMRQPGVECLGYVPDIKPLFQKCSVLVCPILTGSGVRVKVLEAFASGIPVVATRLGAEGIARVPGQYCEFAETPDEFANQVLRLLSEPAYAAALAVRARKLVERYWDSRAATRKLLETYWHEVNARRSRGVTPPAAFAQEHAPTESSEAIRIASV